MAIGEAIRETLSAYEVEDACVRLGLPSAAAHDDDPMNSKAWYVRRGLAPLPLWRVVAIGHEVADAYGRDDVAEILAGFGAQGVDGDMRQLIFAADGPKPRLVLRDAVNNIVEIVEHAEHCLVYDRPLAPAGLTWGELVDWWTARSGLDDSDAAARQLFVRLRNSLDSEPERVLLNAYGSLYRREDSAALPALIPQVYLHYDPYTQWELGDERGHLKRQRMDFLLLLPNAVRIVIEIDGKHHYAADDGSASPTRYADMVSDDRELRLAGYEVYRFGGQEFVGDADAMLQEFFTRLLDRHRSRWHTTDTSGRTASATRTVTRARCGSAKPLPADCRPKQQ